MSKNSAAYHHFFALSACGFKVAAQEQFDGFTIMSVPRIPVENFASSKEDGSEGEQILTGRGKDFILWKASSC